MNERDIFIAALQKATTAERQAFVEEACRGEETLRQGVEALLAAHDRAAGFLESPPVDLPDTPVDCPGETVGTIIGPYKVLEQIGAGGFGNVYAAEQQQPVRRTVAIKVLKPGMDSRHVIARFEAERQALALMDHPNIARVLEAGETASGRPYFAMELVRGIPITAYANQCKLTVRERLELFISVCQAVQHAHQKGIIHRDIKPSNVLVTPQDGRPVIKVIDFGIAKALGPPLTDRTLHTGFAQLVGTPLYMSPEQASLDGLDVDTRSDIYSLGVLLYELLTGTTPFDKERFQEAGYDEIRRIVREEEPLKPSTRISTLGQAATTVSTQRQSDPRRLSQLFRGELDWIVMKALEKDRNRRYETASAFATDVHRYLHDEPVQACPPSAWYRFRKFAWRNRAALALAGLSLLFIVLLGAAAGWLVRDRSARRYATQERVSEALGQARMHLAEGEKEMDNPGRWQMNVALAEEAVRGAEQVLAAGEATPELTGRVAEVRAAVDAARQDCGVLLELERIQLGKAAVRKFAYHDAAAAPRYAAVFRAYGVDPAEPRAAAARVRASRLLPALLAALEDWQRLIPTQTERQHLLAVLEAAGPPADAFRQRWLAAVRRQDGAGLAQLAATPAVQGLPLLSLVNLARDLRDAKEWAAAERLLRDGQERHPGHFWLNHDLAIVLLWQPHPQVEQALRYLTAAVALRSDSPGVHLNLGNALHEKKDLAGAVRAYRAALRLDPHFALAHIGLGNARYDNKDVEGAIRAYQAALEIDPNYALAHFHLGYALDGKGNLEGAIREYRAALNIAPDDAMAHTNLGKALADKKDLEGAIREFQTAIKIDSGLIPAHFNLGHTLHAKKDVDGAIREYRAVLKLDANLAQPHTCLGNALYDKKDLDGAIREHKRALEIDPNYAVAHYNLGNALRARKDMEGAIREYLAALKIDPDLAPAHNSLGNALLAKKDVEGAIREYQAALKIDANDPLAHNNLGVALRARKDFEGAIREYQAALKLDPNYAAAHYGLANALLDKKDMDGAIREYRAALKIDPEYAEAHCNLGQALQRQGRFTDALAAFQKGHKLGNVRPGWHYPSADWVSNVERLIECDAKLPKVLTGETRPANAGECLQFARLCQQPYKQLYTAAAGFYREAFAAQPKLANAPIPGHRFNAACAAALAGCGQGNDAGTLDQPERGRLRREALAWLQADLSAWKQMLEKNGQKARSAVHRQMDHWKQDSDFAGVRGTEALARLPEPERADWQKLWTDVEQLRKTANHPD
jgi:tetratricopeptide (TPR) repeat protein